MTLLHLTSSYARQNRRRLLEERLKVVARAEQGKCRRYPGELASWTFFWRLSSLNRALAMCGRKRINQYT